MQVNQAAFKVNEAGKKLVMSTKNMEKGGGKSPVRDTRLLKESRLPPAMFLSTETAWLSADQKKIDAQIGNDEIYQKKSLRNL